MTCAILSIAIIFVLIGRIEKLVKKYEAKIIDVRNETDLVIVQSPPDTQRSKEEIAYNKHENNDVAQQKEF